MARVPYEPYPTAQPQGGGEQVSVATPGAAFGENIGAALQGLGTTTEHVGGELFNRAIALQELRNEADAREAQNEYAIQTGLKQAHFDSLEGKAQADALPAHLDYLSQLRKDIGSRLTAPMARKHYDADSMPFMQRNIILSASKAGTANKQYLDDTAEASANLAIENIVDPFNETEIQHKIEDIGKAADTRAGIKSWSPEMRDLYVKDKISKLRATQISTVGLTNPGYGFDLLDEAFKNKEVTPEAYRATLANLRTQNRAINGDILAEKIFKEGGSLEEMQAKAREQAPALAHGDDVEFTRHVLNGLTHFQIFERQATLQQKHTDEQTVLDFIHTNHPTTEREVLADPKAGAALHAAQAHGAWPKGVQGLIDGNINDQLNQQNLANYDALRGMAQWRRADFLNMTAGDLHNIQMSKDQRGDILALRKQLIASPINDPRVPEALRALRQNHDAEMRALGVFREPAKDADQSLIDKYDRFLGSLSGALDSWAADNPSRRRPSPEEFEKDIAKPLLHTHKEPWMWFFNQDVGDFNQTIPKDVLDKARDSMKADAEAMGMPQEFTDKEIIREAVRQQWKQFHAKQKESTSGGPTAPGPK